MMRTVLFLGPKRSGNYHFLYHSLFSLHCFINNLQFNFQFNASAQVDEVSSNKPACLVSF